MQEPDNEGPFTNEGQRKNTPWNTWNSAYDTSTVVTIMAAIIRLCLILKATIIVVRLAYLVAAAFCLSGQAAYTTTIRTGQNGRPIANMYVCVCCNVSVFLTRKY